MRSSSSFKLGSADVLSVEQARRLVARSSPSLCLAPILKLAARNCGRSQCSTSSSVTATCSMPKPASGVGPPTKHSYASTSSLSSVVATRLPHRLRHRSFNTTAHAFDDRDKAGSGDRVGHWVRFAKMENKNAPNDKVILVSRQLCSLFHIMYQDTCRFRLSFVWALRDGERSSRVKVADRGFASRQGASLVSIKRGKF